MPTVQGTDDFDHAIDAGFYTDGFFGSPSAVTSPLYPGTAKSLELVSDGGNVGVRHNITGTPTLGWMAFPFRYPVQPGVGQSYTVATFGSTSGAVGALNLGSTGLFVDINGDTEAELATSADTFYWVEAIYDVHTNPHTMNFRVGTTTGTPVSVALAGTSITWSQLVFLSSTAGFTQYYGGLWKWGEAATVTDWLGEPIVGTTYKRFSGPAQLTGSAATLYTCPSGKRARVLNIHASNPSSSPIDFNLSIGADAAATRVYDDFALAADSVESNYDPYDLAAGDVIQGWADTAGTVVLTITGYEVGA